ncbi:MAG: hypothetical protein HY000_37370 [Planctomycetes bacterium]|nr:hypothetical protein [Planctomycetota bacterium]
MDEEKLESSRANRGSAHLQFSLLALVVFIACTAVAMALLWSLPDWIAGPILLFLACVFPAALAALVIYGDENLRAFCLGALFPAGIQFIAVFLYVFLEILSRHTLVVGTPPNWHRFYMDELASPLRHVAGVAWALSILTGCVSVGIRRLVKDHSRSAGGST